MLQYYNMITIIRIMMIYDGTFSSILLNSPVGSWHLPLASCHGQTELFLVKGSFPEALGENMLWKPVWPLVTFATFIATSEKQMFFLVLTYGISWTILSCRIASFGSRVLEAAPCAEPSGNSGGFPCRLASTAPRLENQLAEIPGRHIPVAPHKRWWKFRM